MTNVEALKEVYVALGGNAEDFTATTNDEAIALIATVAGSGSGGGGGMTILCTFQNTSGGEAVNRKTVDKTYAEIIAAAAAGQSIQTVYQSLNDSGEISSTDVLSSYLYESTNNIMQAIGFSAYYNGDNGSLTVYTITFSEGAQGEALFEYKNDYVAQLVYD